MALGWGANGLGFNLISVAQALCLWSGGLLMELFRFSQRQFLKSSGSKKIPFLYLSCLQSLFLLPRVPEVCGHLYLILSKQENRTNSMNWDQPYNSKLLSSADQLVIWCVISCRAFFFFFSPEALHDLRCFIWLDYWVRSMQGWEGGSG